MIGSIAEREHLKWQNAAPIANNPYSPDILERRLSETHNRFKTIDIHALMQQHEQSPSLVEENKSEIEVAVVQRPNIIKFVSSRGIFFKFSNDVSL